MTTSLAGALNKVKAKFSNNEINRKFSQILFDDGIVQPPQNLLMEAATRSHRQEMCQDVISVLYRALEPSEYTWKSIYKSLLIIHHLLIYGSDEAVIAIKEMQVRIENLKGYNTVFSNNKMTKGFQVKTRRLSFSNGSDEGGPVRDEAKEIYELIRDDEGLNKRREDEKAMRDEIAAKEIPPPSRRHSRSGSFRHSGSFGSVSGSSLVVGAQFGLQGEENGQLLSGGMVVPQDGSRDSMRRRSSSLGHPAPLMANAAGLVGSEGQPQPQQYVVEQQGGNPSSGLDDLVDLLDLGSEADFPWAPPTTVLTNSTCSVKSLPPLTPNQSACIDDLFGLPAPPAPNSATTTTPPGPNAPFATTNAIFTGTATTSMANNNGVNFIDRQAELERQLAEQQELLNQLRKQLQQHQEEAAKQQNGYIQQPTNGTLAPLPTTTTPPTFVADPFSSIGSSKSQVDNFAPGFL